MRGIFDTKNMDFQQALDMLRSKGQDLRSRYFSVNFSPCSEQCVEASVIGNKIIGGFSGQDKDFGAFYDSVFFPTNILRINARYNPNTMKSSRHHTTIASLELITDGMLELAGCASGTAIKGKPSRVSDRILSQKDIEEAIRKYVFGTCWGRM